MDWGASTGCPTSVAAISSSKSNSKSSIVTTDHPSAPRGKLCRPRRESRRQVLLALRSRVRRTVNEGLFRPSAKSHRAPVPESSITGFVRGFPAAKRHKHHQKSRRPPDGCSARSRHPLRKDATPTPRRDRDGHLALRDRVPVHAPRVRRSSRLARRAVVFLEKTGAVHGRGQRRAHGLRWLSQRHLP